MKKNILIGVFVCLGIAVSLLLGHYQIERIAYESMFADESPSKGRVEKIFHDIKAKLRPSNSQQPANDMAEKKWVLYHNSFLMETRWVCIKFKNGKVQSFEES